MTETDDELRGELRDQLVGALQRVHETAGRELTLPALSGRIHGGPAIPGLFVPLRIVEAYLALAVSRGVPRPAAWDEAHAVGRRIERALLDAPIDLRPCHNDLLNANFIDNGERIRIVDWEYAGMGDPFFDPGNFTVNHDLTPDEA